MEKQINAGIHIPYWLLATYASLLLALGWFAADACRNYRPVPTVQCDVHGILPGSNTPVIAGCEANKLPPLRYSVHVYAQQPQQRSITLNGRPLHEGNLLACGWKIEQIQQDVTVLSLNDAIVVLDALQDWPGGVEDKQDRSEDAQK